MRSKVYLALAEVRASPFFRRQPSDDTVGSAQAGRAQDLADGLQALQLGSAGTSSDQERAQGLHVEAQQADSPGASTPTPTRGQPHREAGVCNCNEADWRLQQRQSSCGRSKRLSDGSWAEHQELGASTGPDCTRALAQEEGLLSISAVQHLVVFGLGTLDNLSPRHQLALALLLQERLPALQGPVEVYDPVFSPLDKAVLASYGLQVLTRDEGGARVAISPTLFYLPHCEAGLCNALLGANWVPPGSLNRIAILGNSFAQYAQRWGAAGALGQREHRREAPERILATIAASVVSEVPVPDFDYSVASAFNDMGLHAFCAGRFHAG